MLAQHHHIHDPSCRARADCYPVAVYSPGQTQKVPPDVYRLGIAPCPDRPRLCTAKQQQSDGAVKFRAAVETKLPLKRGNELMTEEPVPIVQGLVFPGTILLARYCYEGIGASNAPIVV